MIDGDKDNEALNALREAQDRAWEDELRRDRLKEMGENEWFKPDADAFYRSLR